ncbi:MAG: response regulator transcription factor [Gammaproteobacteria bacterium]|nr:response regulator transcription factor [Gammaproteobacteria bacterium]
MSTKNPTRVLIVEDDPAAAELLVLYFKKQTDWQCDILTDGSEVAERFEQTPYDLVMLDIQLPGLDGLSVCKQLRSISEVGIIITTSTSDEVERVIGFEAGADAYFTKPLPMREMMAVSKNILRRVRKLSFYPISSVNKRKQLYRYHFENWHFDSRRQVVQRMGDEPVELTYNESMLLEKLIRHPGEVLHRATLATVLSTHAWYPSDRTIDVIIARLRKKLNKVVAEDEQVLKTQYGGGYKFAIMALAKVD